MKTQEPTTDSIEKIVCEPIHNANKVRMSDDLGNCLVHLMFSDKVEPAKKPFLYQVIEKRVEHCFTFNINDPRLIMFLAVLSETPGCAMLYCWYLQYWCKMNKVQTLDLDIFCGRVFPNGFPPHNVLSDIWEAQKFQKGNLVDHAQFGESVMH